MDVSSISKMPFSRRLLTLKSRNIAVPSTCFIFQHENHAFLAVSCVKTGQTLLLCDVAVIKAIQENFQGHEMRKTL